MFAQQNDGQSDTVSTEQTGIAIKEQIKGFSDTHIEPIFGKYRKPCYD